MLIQLALTLLQFTGPAGQRVDVNAEEISSIRDPRIMSEGHFGKGTNCILVMSNGRAIAVRNTCDAVRAALQGSIGCKLVCG